MIKSKGIRNGYLTVSPRLNGGLHKIHIMDKDESKVREVSKSLEIINASRTVVYRIVEVGDI